MSPVQTIIWVCMNSARSWLAQIVACIIAWYSRLPCGRVSVLLYAFQHIKYDLLIELCVVSVKSEYLGWAGQYSGRRRDNLQCTGILVQPFLKLWVFLYQNTTDTLSYMPDIIVFSSCTCLLWLTKSHEEYRCSWGDLQLGRDMKIPAIFTP